MNCELHVFGANLEADEVRDFHHVRIKIGKYTWVDFREEGGVVQIYTSGAITLHAVASNRIDLTTSQ